ncbi:MAG: hypothetical protein JRH18_15285 [Deltaproteobacteria bacterium]|nr:hypothetical protein [Deltaproteobacteria bacterium]MBW2153019.1 hypothetical protein [Deltaproteobacteria bacterium]
MVRDVLVEGMYGRIFPKHLEIIPQLNEVYELALAFYESQLLNEDELIRNGAYFARVGERLTRHYLMCTGEPVRLPKHSSSRLRSFFANNLFKTGYATHGLFPYRGKFHPQMIKGLINIMGLKPGDTILDPMMGSGTVLIEATLMGIKSVGIDVSPFCRFMTQAKLNGLVIPQKPLYGALKNYKELFEHFVKVIGQSEQGSKQRTKGRNNWLGSVVRETTAAYEAKKSKQQHRLIGSEDAAVYDFLSLAYLDSAGYAERSNRASPIEQFRTVLERYVFVVEKIQRILDGSESELAEARALEGDARALPLEPQSIDGVLFSPPYSFAIDYLQNDSFHLNYLGEDIVKLREKMIGLRGKKLREKYDLYIADMNQVLSECARVLRAGRLCTIVVGTNDKQLSKVLDVPPEEVPGLHKILADLAVEHSFIPVRSLARRISGIANTMREEYIVILEKT